MHFEPATLTPDRHGDGAVAYLRAIKARKLVVSAVIAATLLGSVLWLVVQTPSYEATSQVLVTAVQDESVYVGLQILRESADPTRTIQTAASLIESRDAARQTASELDGWTADSVLAAIEIKPEGESSILAVTATADDPDEAARLANTFAEQAIDVRSRALQRQIATEIESLEERLADGGPGAGELAVRLTQLETLQSGQDPTLSVAQPATPPDSPAGAGAPLILVLALLGGVALGSAAAVLLELVDQRVRDEDDLLALWPLPVLARIPPWRRRGSVEHAPPAVREAFRTLAVQLERAGASHVILLTGASTGDGKTTSAVNLATSLATAGHRVVLLDFDIRKPDIGRALGLSARSSVTALARSNPALDELLMDVPGLPNLSVLALEPRSGDLPIEAAGHRMPDLIKEARELADFTIVDTAPLGEVSDALRVVQSVDEIIVAARLGNTNRSSFAVTRDLLERSGLTPSGLILLGARHVTSSYYESGRVMRDGTAGKTPPRRTPAP